MLRVALFHERTITVQGELILLPILLGKIKSWAPMTIPRVVFLFFSFSCFFFLNSFTGLRNPTWAALWGKVEREVGAVHHLKSGPAAVAKAVLGDFALWERGRFFWEIAHPNSPTSFRIAR